MVLEKKKLGIVVLIKTGADAELLSWQQHNWRCFVSFVINISGAKFERHGFNTSRDITILAANLMTSSLS